MTREDIVRMAREAYGDWYPNAVPHELERFANLVAAVEREACAKACEASVIEWTEDSYNRACRDSAAAIRARRNDD